jgi:class 3 adenylate cyclase
MTIAKRIKRYTRSIAMRLVALTTLVIVVTIALIVWRWISTQRELLFSEKRLDAEGTAITISHGVMNEIDDANWNQVRLNILLVMRDDPNIAYIIIHSERFAQKIVAAAPPELANEYIPDVIPLAVTRDAVRAEGLVIAEAPLLRDVAIRTRQDAEALRATRGEPMIEATFPIRTLNGMKIGVVRVGMSLELLDRAVAASVRNALAFGGIALVLALLGAALVARRLATPIRHLVVDAQTVAAGKLAHRTTIARGDELGALAKAFNEMASDLEANFGKLEATAASFERFVPRKFLKVIAPAGIENIQIGTAEKRRVSVLFTDLRGFTSLSEGLTPLDVFHLLNDYLARMGGVIDAKGGFVDKYIGDAIMALFDDDTTDRVVQAVMSMRRALHAFNQERAARGLPKIDSGIGVHGGEVVMGTIGFASKIESTVIGDAVNVASRVEGMTKDYKVSVLITGEIVKRLDNPSIYPLQTVALGVMVRGRDEPIDLYTIDEELMLASASMDHLPRS